MTAEVDAGCSCSCCVTQRDAEARGRTYRWCTCSGRVDEEKCTCAYCAAVVAEEAGVQ